MSDEDVNKVHELAEHEDQKTFQYMLQGKDNGRINLGSAADNAELIGETPDKKRKKEFEDLLIKTAGMIALEKADEAIQGMAGALKAMGESLNKAQKYIDRSGYLRDQLLTITALLQNGTEDAKLRYLMEQGYSHDQIDQIKANGDADVHLKALGKEMGGEFESLRELIEIEAQSYQENKVQYQTNRSIADQALKKAEAEGNTLEVERRREEIETLDTDFTKLEGQYGETILVYKNSHSDFDTIWGDFIEKDNDNKSYEDLAKNRLNEDLERNVGVITSIREQFNQAATGEPITNDKSLESNISSIDSMPKLNTVSVDF
ncbi:MAG: hypothetical protein RLN81_03030 [Balneolaceae bacterium]